MVDQDDMRTLIAPWSGARTDWIDGMMGRRLATEGTSVGLGPIRRARVCRFAPFAYIKELATWKAGWKRGTGSCDVALENQPDGEKQVSRSRAVGSRNTRGRTGRKGRVGSRPVCPPSERGTKMSEASRVRVAGWLDGWMAGGQKGRSGGKGFGGVEEKGETGVGLGMGMGRCGSGWDVDVYLYLPKVPT